MSSRPRPSDRRHPARVAGRRILGVIAVGGLAGALAIFGASGFMRMSRLKDEVRTVEQDVRTQREKSDRLSELVNCLRSDPACTEKFAREDLGMVREGETILRLPSAPAR